MRRLLLACLPLLAATALSGCVAALVGGAVATGVRIAHDRRPASTVVNDRNLQLSVIRALHGDQNLTSHNNVRVVVYNGVILLIGEVVSDAARQRAGELASGFIGARRVVNQLDIAPEPGFWSSRADEALAARVKAGLLDITSLPGFDPTRVNVSVAHGNIYLMGLVTHTEGDAVIQSARNANGANKVVNLFEYIDAAPAAASSSAVPAPAASAPAPAASSEGVSTYPLQH
ncbi:MAG TPA: BON domain-containing protein [Rhodanobacteraceae bacterium]|nr:BON domain-containing protein [Rhodanobacteraceae bacterium]